MTAGIPHPLSTARGWDKGREDFLNPSFYGIYGGEQGIRTPGLILTLKEFLDNRVLIMSFSNIFNDLQDTEAPYTARFIHLGIALPFYSEQLIKVRHRVI
jgi:hypothetical protein